MSRQLTRRKLIGAASTGIVAARVARAASDKPAILGGRPIRTSAFPSWPVIDDNEERAWMKVLRSGKWNRLDGECARQFEETWAQTLGAKHCLATANGTSCGSDNDASSTSHPPSAKSPTTRRATFSARELFPMPPGPVSVTTR